MRCPELHEPVVGTDLDAVVVAVAVAVGGKAGENITPGISAMRRGAGLDSVISRVF